VIRSFTEYLVFLSRLYEEIAPDATVGITITLRGCKGRQLTGGPRVMFFGNFYIAQENVIRREREVQVAELRIASDDRDRDGETRLPCLRVAKRDGRDDRLLATTPSQSSILNVREKMV